MDTSWKSVYLHIRGQDENVHEVSAETFARCATCLQTLVSLVATAQVGEGERRRLLGNTSLVNDCRVVFSVPEAGSVKFPWRVIGDTLLAGGVLLLQVFLDISEGKTRGLPIDNLGLPNRLRFVREMAKIAQEQTHGYFVSIDWQDEKDGRIEPHEFCFSQESIEKARQCCLGETEIAEETDTIGVIGELVAVHFRRNEIRVRYPETGTEIKCSCIPEVLDDIQCRRTTLVQVVGKFTMDEEGHPKELTDVSSVEEVDLSDIEIPFVPFEDKQIRRKDGKNIVFHPKLDEETKQVFLVDDEETGVRTHGTSRADLTDAILEDLAGNWELAQEPDEALAWGAPALKKKMLALFEEI